MHVAKPAHNTLLLSSPYRHRSGASPTCTWTWSAGGFKYLFTMVDRSSRWLEAVPLKSMAAEDCVDVLISEWVARFGMPTIITSDQGRQFTSSLWAGLTKLLGVKHVQTTAYHPQSNGMVERAHGQLKAALRSRLAGSRWPEHLPWVLLGLRTAPKEGSGILAAELVYGAALALPAAPRPPLHMVVQPQHPPAAATRGGTVAVYSNI